ncbi:thioesterase II family protein [Streptomyces sp. NPDC055036]
MTGDNSVRLFCLPVECVSASVYLPWAKAIGPSAVVKPVELAGRGRHPRTLPCGGLEPLMAELMPYLARICDRSFALYGHGFGALLAYEVAARLAWEHDAVAERLHVSGSDVPHRPAPERASAICRTRPWSAGFATGSRMPPVDRNPRRAAGC